MRGVDTGLKNCIKIHKNLEISENSSKILKIHEQLEIYDNSSTILKFMNNTPKSITILENLRKSLILQI
jgi:hypothetical protein